MTKTISDETKEAIRKDVAEARKNGKPTLKTIAAKWGIHPTMISKIAPPNGATRTVKAAPKNAKRKTSKVTNKPKKLTINDYDKAFRKYLRLRDETSTAWQELTMIAEKLK